MRSGVKRSMRSPMNRIAPGSGAPAIRLKSVVLPAPFGPMSPVIVPASIARSTPSTARRFPNALTTPDTSSMTPDYGKPSSLDAHDLSERVHDLDEVVLRLHDRADRLVGSRGLVDDVRVLPALDAGGRRLVIGQGEASLRLVA